MSRIQRPRCLEHIRRVLHTDVVDANCIRDGRILTGTRCNPDRLRRRARSNLSGQLAFSDAYAEFMTRPVRVAEAG